MVDLAMFGAMVVIPLIMLWKAWRSYTILVREIKQSNESFARIHNTLSKKDNRK